MSIALNVHHTLRLPGHAPAFAPPAKTDSCMHSTDLLRGKKVVDIVHNGSTYRLQATRLGKLILTK